MTVLVEAGEYGLANPIELHHVALSCTVLAGIALILFGKKPIDQDIGGILSVVGGLALVIFK